MIMADKNLEDIKIPILMEDLLHYFALHNMYDYPTLEDMSVNYNLDAVHPRQVHVLMVRDGRTGAVYPDGIVSCPDY